MNVVVFGPKFVKKFVRQYRNTNAFVPALVPAFMPSGVGRIASNAEPGSVGTRTNSRS